MIQDLLVIYLLSLLGGMPILGVTLLVLRMRKRQVRWMPLSFVAVAPAVWFVIEFARLLPGAKSLSNLIEPMICGVIGSFLFVLGQRDIGPRWVWILVLWIGAFGFPALVYIAMPMLPE